MRRAGKPWRRLSGSSFMVQGDRSPAALLKGTKTHENLKDAFAGESQANRRYLYFAKIADVEGYPEVAGNFRDTAEGETGPRARPPRLPQAVGDPATGLPIGDTESNLKAAIAGETHEYTDMYPGMAKTAREEGFDRDRRLVRDPGEGREVPRRSLPEAAHRALLASPPAWQLPLAVVCERATECPPRGALHVAGRRSANMGLRREAAARQTFAGLGKPGLGHASRQTGARRAGLGVAGRRSPRVAAAHDGGTMVDADDKNISYKPDRRPLLRPERPKYWDEGALAKEITRVFEVCHGCRMCFKYCDSFPTLFEFIDDEHDGDVRKLGADETAR
jgi:rubrerythrin